MRFRLFGDDTTDSTSSDDTGIGVTLDTPDVAGTSCSTASDCEPGFQCVSGVCLPNAPTSGAAGASSSSSTLLWIGALGIAGAVLMSGGKGKKKRGKRRSHR